MDNYLWHAARAFFQEGGRRLYVSSVSNRPANEFDGYARATVGTGATALTVRARFPGVAGANAGATHVALESEYSQHRAAT